MGNLFSGCFIYADDITLVAPSADALNAMLKVVCYMQGNMILHSTQINLN